MASSGHDRRPARRLLGVLIVGMLLGSNLAACARTTTNGDVLVVLSGRDDSMNRQQAALVDEWNVQNPDNRARFVEVSDLADQQHDEMLKDAQAAHPLADVYNLDMTWTAEFADAGYIRPLSDVGPDDVKDFLQGPLESGRYENVLYALPFNTDAGLTFYRTDLLSKCPTSWDDLDHDANDLAARPGPRPDAVWAGQLAGYEGLVVNVLESLYSDLPPDRRNLFTAGLPELRAAVDRLSPRRHSKTVASAALDYSETASTQALRQGKVAALRNWPVAYATLSATSPENPQTGKNIGFCQLPGNGVVLGGQDLAVSARSRQPAMAEKLIAFLTSPSSEARIFTEGKLAPTRSSAYFGAQQVGSGLGSAIETAVGNATPRPVGPCYLRFSELFSQEVHQNLQDLRPLPDDFLDQLQRALTCKPPR